MILLASLVLMGLGVSASEDQPEPEGKKRFVQYKCNSCHVVQAQGIEQKKVEGEEATGDRKPPDLSGVGLKRKSDWIIKYIGKKEMIEGQRHPKKFRGTEADAKAIAGWLETLKTEIKKENKN